MAVLLFKQILSMMIMIACGFVLVRSGKCRAEDSEVLSSITIFLILPCVVINSFQIDMTAEIRTGFYAAVAAAVLIHMMLFLLCAVFRKIWKTDAIETASVFYSNAGNMIIPLVAAVLGEDMLIYASAFLCVQTILMWTHGHALVSGMGLSDIRGMLKNPNLIAVMIGVIMFFSGLRVPEFLRTPMNAMASIIGPVSMFCIGMILTKVEWRELFRNARLYLIMILKMIVVPLAALIPLKALCAVIPLPGLSDVLLVSFMAVIAPSAVSVMQMANVYKKDAVYAGAINALTTVVCIVTMPVMVMLYQAVM